MTGTKSKLINYYNKKKRSLVGWVFLFPALYGLVYFFIIPVFKSFLFSISDISTGSEGYKMAISGIAAYKEALFSHTSYRQDVVTTFISVLTTTPLIIIFSFFISSVLNQNFRGRTFFRVVFFLPVIAAELAGDGNSLENSMNAFGGFKSDFGGTTVSVTSQITTYLINIGLSEDVAGILTTIADSVYSVVDISGVQILVLLVGMQSISPALYEAAHVEGCTSWESFWKITFPMISPLLFTCVIYTVLDSFTRSGSTVMTLINDTAFAANPNFSLASAMGWIYFAIVGAFLGVVSLLLSRLIFYYDN